MNTNKRIWRGILAFSAAAAVAAAVGIFAWSKGVFLPRWIEWNEKTLDLEENKTGLSKIVLRQRNLTVEKKGETVWESPKGVLVQDFLWCDINHDEKDELILLCWRIGRYGDAKPYWVEEDEKTWSQHIYIYQWNEEKIDPLWMASDIGMDVAVFAFDEKRRMEITEQNGRVTYWDWISWGLERVKGE